MSTAESRTASSDFTAVRLGDRRLDRRLVSVVAALEEQPEASFPKVFDTGAELEGFYRLVGNDRVDWSAVLDGHVESTVRRAKTQGRALALHDCRRSPRTASNRCNPRRRPPVQSAPTPTGEVRMGSPGGETREACRAPTGDTRARCSLVTGHTEPQRLI